MADNQKMTVAGLFKATLVGFCKHCEADISVGDLIGFLRGYVACAPCKNGRNTQDDTDSRGFL